MTREGAPSESIIVIGGGRRILKLIRHYIERSGKGLLGLACAVEAQTRNPHRQVDIVAQIFVTDPPPGNWTTGLSVRRS